MKSAHEMAQWERRELFLRRLDSAEFMARTWSSLAQMERNPDKAASKHRTAQDWHLAAQKTKVLYNSTL